MNQQINSSSVVLIVGGTGSVGSILTKKFLDLGVRQVRVIARDETRHQQLIDSLGKPENLISIVGDIRDQNSLDEAMNGVDIVINAAAMKHVKYCESYPIEAFKTNVGGTENIIALCIQKNIKQMVLISTDKAAEPSTAYGASKFMAERIVISAALRHPGYQYVAVRFGNIVGSRNSVLSRLQQLLDTNMPVAIVKEPMTRYIMTPAESAELVIEALEAGQSGAIFIRNMRVVQVQNLIHTFVARYALHKKVNPRKFKVVEHETHRGEKSHESLFSQHERERTYISKNTLTIVPGIEVSLDSQLTSQFTYNSEHALKLTSKQIDTLLEQVGY